MTTKLYDGDTFEHAGRTFHVTFPYDNDATPPWEREDGHGPVSDWRHAGHDGRMFKAPGELVLCTDRYAYRVYDFAEACKIALRDGWGWLPGELSYREVEPGLWHATAGDFNGYAANPNEAIRALYAAHRASMSPRAYAADAARHDFDLLRRWCNDQWHYVGVVVCLADEDGNPIEEICESTWGLESYGEYTSTVARELADELLPRLEARDAVAMG